MEDKVLISKEELEDLLTAQAKLQILECDGVDNWSYYMEGLDTFLEEAGLNPKEDGLRDYAKLVAKNYYKEDK